MTINTLGLNSIALTENSEGAELNYQELVLDTTETTKIIATFIRAM